MRKSAVHVFCWAMLDVRKCMLGKAQIRALFGIEWGRRFRKIADYLETGCCISCHFMVKFNHVFTVA